MLLKDKKDLIILLNLLIELTLKHYYRYKEYYKELFEIAIEQISKISSIKKESIKENNFIDIIGKLVKNDDYIINCGKLKYEYSKYKSIEDKIGNVQGQILNLLGDRTSKGGVSYWRFRNEYNKMKDKMQLPTLMEFSEEFNCILNELYRTRNYCHHMTDAKFIEWKNYREKQLSEAGYTLFQIWPCEKIEIDRYEYISVEWIWQLVLSQIDFNKAIKQVIMQMKKDYSMLYGESIYTPIKWNEVMLSSHFEVSINGIKRHQGKIK